MAKQEFKYIRGKCAPGMPADICFYTDVECWSVQEFIWEWDWMVNQCPSKIRIHINSCGGSVVDGMSVFAKIMDCPIHTQTINDALAASMGSIIWAAGDELLMKDYALLMIHNPFCDVDGDKQYNQATEAFRQQIKTIYMKRFCLSEEDVDDIMNGKEGEDGTFLTAAQAVEKGFLKAENIIETPKAVKDQINDALRDTKDIARIKAVFGLVAPTTPYQTINEQDNKSISSAMDTNHIKITAALLGIAEDNATQDNVTAKITEMKSMAEKAEASMKELETTKAELTKAQAELTGAKTAVSNLTADLEATKKALDVYREAEEKAQMEKVQSLIDQAVADCKINKDEREAYTAMAVDNYDLAVNVLSKIPARDNLSKIISEANVGEAKDRLVSEEEKVMAHVSEVVGKDFKFRTLD